MASSSIYNQPLLGGQWPQSASGRPFPAILLNHTLNGASTMGREDEERNQRAQVGIGIILPKSHSIPIQPIIGQQISANNCSINSSSSSSNLSNSSFSMLFPQLAADCSSSSSGPESSPSPVPPSSVPILPKPFPTQTLPPIWPPNNSSLFPPSPFCQILPRHVAATIPHSPFFAMAAAAAAARNALIASGKKGAM
jgi:hypothetical protein